MKLEKEFCPMCPKGCEKDTTRCEKGKEYFQSDGKGQTGRPHSFTGQGLNASSSFHHGRSPRHFEDQLPPDSLAGLLMRCGHYLFRFLRSDDALDKAFGTLSECERMELQSLLTRLITSWKHQSF